MLGGKHHIFHSGVLHDSGPLFRVEFGGIELVLQAPVPFLVLVVRHVPPAVYPVDILGANAPRLYNAGHRVKPPVEDDAELEVAPPVELFTHFGIGRPFVGRATAVYVGTHFLCGGMKGKKGREGHKRQMSETILEHIFIDVRENKAGCNIPLKEGGWGEITL